MSTIYFISALLLVFGWAIGKIGCEEEPQPAR